jgi:hypothetical protein
MQPFVPAPARRHDPRCSTVSRPCHRATEVAAKAAIRKPKWIRFENQPQGDSEELKNGESSMTNDPLLILNSPFSILNSSPHANFTAP